jgi:hypothetical protein
MYTSIENPAIAGAANIIPTVMAVQCSIDRVICSSPSIRNAPDRSGDAFAPIPNANAVAPSESGYCRRARDTIGCSGRPSVAAGTGRATHLPANGFDL